jgi:ferritin-like metal-binding protein YciE
LRWIAPYPEQTEENMPADNIQQQLDKYLADAHSIEEQALAQLRKAPNFAANPQFAQTLSDHLTETERHEELIRRRLDERGAGQSRFKDLIMAATGVGFALFAKLQPDSPGKLAAHAYSYEHLEVASYELLIRVAERARDAETAAIARTIRDEEQRAGERIAESFDAVAEASLLVTGTSDPGQALITYLSEAHALEAQAIQLLEGGSKSAGDEVLERLFAEHLEESREHQSLVEQRLQAHEGGPSAIKDAALRLGAVNWSGFFVAQPDTPGKLAVFSYAFEHLEIAGYELLSAVARLAGDQETVQTAGMILDQERAAASKIAATFDRAAEASLRAHKV